jgi:transposase
MDDERLRRHDLTDAQWAVLESLMPAQPRQGHRWHDHRMIIDGVFHRTRTGTAWRDLPERFGPWQTVYNRHRRSSGDGTWEQILAALQTDCDQDEAAAWTVSVDSTVDSTVVRAHQHAAGARHAAPKDIDADRLAPITLSRPRGSGTGGEIE